MNDFKQAFRQLRKHPFTNAVIVTTIALLVGAISVIYASLQNERARYEPFPESEQLVKFWRVAEKRPDQLYPPGMFREFSERLQSFAAIGAIENRLPMTLTDAGEPVTCKTVAVSPDLFPILRIQPAKGRIFDQLDFGNNSRAVIVSHQLWQRTLNEDPEVINREIRLNDQPFHIVGVLPDSMNSTRVTRDVDIWLPATFDDDKFASTLQLIARLKDDATLTQAQAELDVVAPPLEVNQTPDHEARQKIFGTYTGTRALALSDHFHGDGGASSDVLMGLAFAGAILASVIGIACFNVANLLLARLAARSREFAVRIAMGARRTRIFGLLFSVWIFDLFRLQNVDVRFDWKLYAIALGGTILLGLFVGLLPALHVATRNLTDGLNDGGHNVGGTKRHRLRNFLIISEVGMALVLCVIAGLMTRPFMARYTGDLGFKPDRTIAMQVALRPDVYHEFSDRETYAEAGLQALREMPGIEKAAVELSSHPLAWTRDNLDIEERNGEERTVVAAVNFSGRHATEILGMPLSHGRGFSEARSDSMSEALVNELFVERFLSDGDPLGRRIQIASCHAQVTVVGVVRNRHPRTHTRDIQPEITVDYRNANLLSGLVFTAQTSAPATAMAPAIRETLQRLNADQPVGLPVTLEDYMKQRDASPRAALLTLSSLAAVGLFLSMIGVSGVIGFSVVERRREIGIRMALGSSRAATLRLILWQGGRQVLLGALPGAAVGSLLISVMPGGVLGQNPSPFDPLALALISVVVVASFLCASVIPARRAANLNPMEALRHD